MSNQYVMYHDSTWKQGLMPGFHWFSHCLERRSKFLSLQRQRVKEGKVSSLCWFPTFGLQTVRNSEPIASKDTPSELAELARNSFGERSRFWVFKQIVNLQDLFIGLLTPCMMVYPRVSGYLSYPRCEPLPK